MQIIACVAVDEVAYEMFCEDDKQGLVIHEIDPDNVFMKAVYRFR